MARPHDPRKPRNSRNDQNRNAGERNAGDLTGRSDRDLLGRIGRSAGGKAGYKQLIRELGLGGGRERRLLLEQLANMVGRGDLIRTGEEMWSIPRTNPSVLSPTARMPAEAAGREAAGREAGGNAGRDRPGRDRFAAGRLDLHRDGFGFVRPEPGGSAGAGSSRDGLDIFIPPNEINGAMQGDLVLVDEAPPGRDGRRSGRIARVLTRRNPTVVGIFHYERAHRSNGQRLGPADRNSGGRRADSAFNPAHAIGNFVTPLDERIGGVIAIAEGDDVVPLNRDSPHRMMGAETRAQVAQQQHFRRSAEAGDGAADGHSSADGESTAASVPDTRFPLEGLAVDVEITSFPAPGRPARGRVIEVLGHPDSFGVDVEIVIRKHHIPHTFPAPVLAEATDRARDTVSSLADEELAKREDFRGFPIVTIDGETARDFDDAVLVRDLPNGNSELQVHIADVSWYVRPGSALDTEARVRGTSVYFPDRAVPMLPHALSSGMCSLLPNEDRLVLSCIMEIDGRGEIVGYRLAEGIIRSVRRMTYTSVQHCINAQKNSAKSASETRFENVKEGLEQTEAAPEPTAEDFAERERVGLEQPELPAAIDRMLELALRLNAKRVRRGSIDFDLPEPVVEFDPDGNMKAIVRSERGWSHRLIEEFMLSANECVATWLQDLGIPSIYRIHEMPDPKRIVDFEETAAGFGHSLGLGNLPVRKLTMKSDRRESKGWSVRGKDSRAPQQHEIPQSIPVTPQMYQKLVRRISGTPEERILSYLMLRSLKQARYAEKNEGHFALASPHYTHFTSPIRRYPDLIVHRLVRAMLRRGADARGGAIRSDDPQPWLTELESARGGRGSTTAGLSTALRSGRDDRFGVGGRDDKFGGGAREHRLSGSERGDGPIAAEELNDIAVESSQAERRAADAERELIEWKKMRFMEDRVGDDFSAIILSVTKYGFFVELDELFIEGLVPIASLVGDFYSFRDTDRTICGARSGHCFAIGQRVHVLLDRIDRQQRRLQFALLPGTEPKASSGAGSLRSGKSEAKKAKAKVGGKAKARQRKKKR